MCEYPKPYFIKWDFPLGRKRIDVRTDEFQSLVNPRNWQVVNSETALSKITSHRTDRHSEHRRRHHFRQTSHHLGHRVGRILVDPGCTTESRGKIGEERAIRIEGVSSPLRTTARDDIGGREIGSGEVTDMHTCDRHKRLEGHARRWVYIRFLLPTSRSKESELSCSIPIDRPLPRHCFRNIAKEWNSAKGIF